jgi:hypothetical protein
MCQHFISFILCFTTVPSPHIVITNTQRRAKTYMKDLTNLKVINKSV